MRAIPAALFLFLAAGCEPTRADLEKQVVLHKLVPVATAATGEVLGVAFAQSGDSLGCLWLERADALQGRLRFATFDGTSWTDPVAIAGVDPAAATQRPLALEGSDSGWRAVWFDSSGPVRAERAGSGSSWKMLSAFPSGTAGNGPLSWADLRSAFPSVGYVGEHKTPAGAVEDVACLTHADPRGKGLETHTFETRAVPAADVSLLRFQDHLLMAYRKSDPADSHDPERTNLRLEDLTRADKSNAEFHKDGWKIPASARGPGPLLIAQGDKVSLVAATQLGDIPGLAVFQGWVRPEANHEGPDPFRLIGFEVVGPLPETQRDSLRGPPLRLPTFGQASDLHVHLAADGSLVIASLEELRPILRLVGKSGTAIERLGDSALDPSTVLVWAGALAGHEYLATTAGKPAKVSLLRVAD